MTDDDIRDELLVHLSKAALDSGPKAIDRIAGTVATVSGTLLAAYFAALGFLKPSYRDRQHLFLTAIPVLIWLITLPVSLFLTLPRNVRVNVKAAWRDRGGWSGECSAATDLGSGGSLPDACEYRIGRRDGSLSFCANGSVDAKRIKPVSRISAAQSRRMKQSVR